MVVGFQHQHLPSTASTLGCANREMVLSPPEHHSHAEEGLQHRQSNQMELKRLPEKEGLGTLLLPFFFLIISKQPCSGEPFLLNAVDLSLLQDELSFMVPLLKSSLLCVCLPSPYIRLRMQHMISLSLWGESSLSSCQSCLQFSHL